MLVPEKYIVEEIEIDERELRGILRGSSLDIIIRSCPSSATASTSLSSSNRVTMNTGRTTGDTPSLGYTSLQRVFKNLVSDLPTGTTRSLRGHLTPRSSMRTTLHCGCPMTLLATPTVDCDNCAETGLWNKDFVELILCQAQSCSASVPREFNYIDGVCSQSSDSNCTQIS